MADLSLALNSEITILANGATIAVADAMDMAFVICGCTSFKIQGSTDGGSTYNDIAGTGSTLGSSGTLTTSVAYMMSLIRCRFDHLKVVHNGSNSVAVVRHWLRQSPTYNLDRTKQTTIIDPVAGTA